MCIFLFAVCLKQTNTTYYVCMVHVTYINTWCPHVHSSCLLVEKIPSKYYFYVHIIRITHTVWVPELHSFKNVFNEISRRTSIVMWNQLTNFKTFTNLLRWNDVRFTRVHSFLFWKKLWIIVICYCYYNYNFFFLTYGTIIDKY